MIDRPTYIRAIEPFMDTSVIKVLVGVRRSGKSTLLRLIANRLLERNVDANDIFTLDFESARYFDIVAASDLISYCEKHLNPNKRQYLFLDEIQEVEGWEKALRSLLVDYDVDLYVTGSNAHLLSSDLATYITGRYVRIPVYPFSFTEWLSAIEEQRSVRRLENFPEDMASLFRRFIEQGGFPFQAELNFDRDSMLHYLQDVYSTVLLRDVVQKNEFRDVEQLNRIVTYVIREIGHSFSAQNIADYLKSERRKISVETVYSYLHAAEEACLLYRVSREDVKGKRSLKFQEKYYVVDQGLRQCLGLDNRSAIDQVLENVVYMELLRRGYRVTVGKAGSGEIDFVARREESIEYYQVSYLIADETVEEREFGTLEAVHDHHPKYVLSLDDYPRTRNGVIGKNLIQWLSDGE